MGENIENCSRKFPLHSRRARVFVLTLVLHILLHHTCNHSFIHSSIQVREESSSTRLWFVTTGYLVALLAHHMESFSKYTHLVIDEVHERSADGDIICLLAKKVRLPS